MSLDVAKLEKVRELAGGIVQARCPACAEGGNDRAGEHLRVYPDGRFGCCVHPKDGIHRKRIWALAGVRQTGTFGLRLKTPPALPAARSVTAAFASFDSGTLGTPEKESENGVPAVPDSPTADFGTFGTALLKLRAHTRGELPPVVDNILEKLEDLDSAVLSVPSDGAPEPPSAAGKRLPFLTASGDLSIPFDSPERYHWWRGGQSVAETLHEVRAALAIKKG